MTSIVYLGFALHQEFALVYGRSTLTLLYCLLKNVLCTRHSTCIIAYCCRWIPYKTVNVPPSANFRDYSGMAFSGERFGVVSQVRDSGESIVIAPLMMATYLRCCLCYIQQ